MSGIAGIIDLTERREVPGRALRSMIRALAHRGPDEEALLERPGLGLAVRQLRMAGLTEGWQPFRNEDRSIFVIGDGALYETAGLRRRLEHRGHRFLTHSSSEVLPHLWEEHQEQLLEQIRGQFAFCLWDQSRQQLLLARDRFGICPLYWTRSSLLGPDWLLFASEIKALLASGLVAARPDVRGLDMIFNFFASPGPLSCFQGIEALQPGHYLKIQRRQAEQSPCVSDRTYWTMDFPDQGDELQGQNAERMTEECQALLRQAVARRLPDHVRVASYLSGGVDSGLVAALAKDVRGQTLSSFTIQVTEPTLDESDWTGQAARHLDVKPVVVPCSDFHVVGQYQRLVAASEVPVVDTACAGLLMLADEVQQHGYRVVLTGEGADEVLAGHPWFRLFRLLGRFDAIPGLTLSSLVRYCGFRALGGSPHAWRYLRRLMAASGGPNPYHQVYGLMSLARFRFFSPALQKELADHNPYEIFQPDLDRLCRWHPLHRGIYWGCRIHVPGTLLNLKNDRVAMHSSVQTRFPFLDEDLFAFLAPLHPHWKMHQLGSKYLFRRVAERWLPREIAWRQKELFRAPMDSFFLDKTPAYAEDLLSTAALNRTGYFDPQAVQTWRQRLTGMRKGSYARTAVEMGLVAVLATQLWHHTYIDSTLTDLPDWRSFLRVPTPTLARAG